MTKRKKAERCLEREAFLNLLHLADELTGQLVELLRPSELSATQYNVLRILRGAGEEGMPCGMIGDRMITREPDMTRLLDRLEKRALIRRARQTDDRRVVKAFLTKEGAGILQPLDEPVLELHKQQLGGLGKQRLAALVEILEEVRGGIESGQ